MNGPIIEVKDLSKQYTIGQRAPYGSLREEIMQALAAPFKRSLRPSNNTIWALKDVSFEVQEGEVLGIIGKNGAGKSTLLKILSRITEPTGGRVELRGRVASLLEVGTGFHPELTGRENILLNGALLGMTREEIREKFDEIVAFSEIEKFLDTPVKRYSSGMYVRLAFAVAAHLEPEILLIDEVLAVGDASFQKKCLGKMGDVARGGRTVLFVSHNMGAVSSLCTKGILLVDGRVEFSGDVDETISRYSSLSGASAGGSVDLSGHTANRAGPKAHAFIRSLSLLDEEGNPVDILRMGQKARFRIEIDFKHGGNNYEIGIGIGNLYDTNIHYLVSNWEGFHEIPEPGVRTIEVEIPSVYLFPGRYQVMVWEKLQSEVPCDDIVREALGFVVEEGRVTEHPAYFQRYSKNTQVYVPSFWRLVS
jgi:lipopolysaccharide transport system ATP-binding protein